MSSVDRASADLLHADERERSGESIADVPALLDGARAAWLVTRIARGDDLRRTVPDPWQGAEGARVRIARAIGQALTGSRAAAFLSGPDAGDARDQLAAAAARGIPLVVHVSLRATLAHGIPLGTGHDVLGPLAGTGAIVVVARDVQDVLDLSIVARRAAEAARLPVVVAMDRDEIATSPAAVRLPTIATVHRYLGDPTRGVEPVGAAEAMCVGSLRRRMPRLLDAEHPLTLGAVSGADVWPHAAMARELFEADEMRRAWPAAADAWRESGGRALASVHAQGASRAGTVLLTTGWLGSILERVIDDLPRRAHRELRVVTLRALCPLDETALVAACEGAERVVVLERSRPVDAEDTPLAALVRGVLGRAVEHGTTRRRGMSLTRAKTPPEVHAVRVGLGGAAVRAGDLDTLARSLARGDAPPVAVGIDVARVASDYPKRRVLAERLGRIASTAASRTLRADTDAHRGSVALGIEDHASTRVAEHFAQLLADAGVGVRTLTREDSGAQRTVIAIDRNDPSPPAIDDRPAIRVRVDESWRGDVAGAIGAIAARLVPMVPALSERKLLAAASRAFERMEPEVQEANVARVRDALSAADSAPAGLSFPDATAAPVQTAAPVVPLRAREHGNTGDTLGSLARFWDHVGVLYRDGRVDELSSDPYLGTGALPPYTAALRPAHPSGLPLLDTSRCTGCGECWTFCPEGALGTLLLSSREVLEWGLKEAARSGKDASALQSILSRLAPALARVLREEPSIPNAGECVRRAFAAISPKLPESRRERLAAAAEELASALAPLPLVRSTALHDDAEAEEPGAGMLLSILPDPEICTSCELCVKTCAADALEMHPITPDGARHARAAWSLWSRLPDPSGPAIARAARHDEVGLAAATFASRHASMATASSRRDGPGSGETLAVRLALGAAESARQPVVAALGREVAARREALGAEVREVLAGALPTEDLDALAEGLSLSDTHDVSLGEITGRLERAENERLVDRDRLAALVDAARRLADLEWRLVHGSNDTGRARVALLVAGEGMAARVAHFPDTVFAAPTVVDTSPEAPATAIGVAQGLCETIVEDVRLLRRARLLLDHPLPEAEVASEALATLTWQDLTGEERRWATPLVVLADEASLSTPPVAFAEAVADAGLPITLLLLADGAVDTAGADRELALLGLAAGRALAVQSSIGLPDHLVSAVRAATTRSGPAVVRVPAPSPKRHGFPAAETVERARAAVATRVLPVFRYEPGDAAVFGAGIDLTGNPDPLELWARDDDARHLTPATFAHGESRNASRFRVPDAGEDLRSVADLLSTPPAERGTSTAVVTTGDGTARAVDDEILAWCHARMATWRILQELSGLVTPFTDRVRDAAERDVAARRQAELESLRESHARELREAEARVRSEIYGTVRERLVELAARGRREGAPS